MKRIDLRPEHLKRADRIHRVDMFRGGIMLTVTLAVAGWAAVAVMQVQQLKERVAAAEAEVAPLRQQHANLEAVRTEWEQLADELATIQALREPVGPASVLASLSDLAPEEAVLRELVLEMPPPRLEADDEQPEPVRLELRGVAKDDVTVARMVSRLSRERVFQSIRLASSREVTFRNSSGQEFRITMHIPLKWGAAVAQQDGLD